jgi:hypothetical protein
MISIVSPRVVFDSFAEALSNFLFITFAKLNS